MEDVALGDGGSNQLVIDEPERTLQDALFVVRCLVNKKFLIASCLAPEIELSWQLGALANVLLLRHLMLFHIHLSANAGLNSISIVTELRNRHAQGEMNAMVHVRKAQFTNILLENVMPPLLVSTSAITLATESVRMILKIDGIVAMR